MKRAGLKDLATLLSLHPSTVSRALSDHPDVKQETKQRVKDAAKYLQYSPNLHARFFRKKSSQLVALILPEFNPFFVQDLVASVSEHLHFYDLSLIVFYTQNDFEKEKEAIHLCNSWLVDGVLAVLSHHTTDLDHFGIFVENQIPIVLLDDDIETDKITTVTIDERQAAYDATYHIVSQDKTNILGIFGTQSQKLTQKRLAGFKQCLQDHNIPFSSFDIVFVEKDNDHNLIDQKLRNTPYNGIFLMSDVLLIQSYPLFIKYGLMTPSVIISVISAGVLPLQLYHKIPFIKHSGYDLGLIAVTTLFKIMKNEMNQPQNIKVPAPMCAIG